jgi:cytochrome c peroxidase
MAGQPRLSSACSTCHPAALFTDLESYDVGTGAACDKPNARFDTPTLVELWRTAPYLHDGSAATLREVLTSRNPNDRHGRTSRLSRRQLDDLCTYLLSL